MTDYISRDEIFSVWRSMPKPASISSLVDAINRTPAADVEPVRHGRWIPCSERLPDMPGDYLVCTKNEYYGTKNVSKRYFNGGCWSGRWTNITHWMPLPEPPEEGDDGNGLD